MAMDPNPKSAKYKVAFTGTNSSGKTTMALDVTARLKAEEHVLAEVVSSQDRKITWKDDHFPVNPAAHYGMIATLIRAEVEACLKGDATIVVTDRSALDLYAIASYDHPDSKLVKDLGVMVRSWLTTYSRIYYLPPLAYQEDGKRPSDDFRMKTHARLLELIDEWKPDNLVMFDRHEAYKDIKANILQLPSRKVDIVADAKWNIVSKTSGSLIAVKAKKSEVTSDLDCWMFSSDLLNVEEVQHRAERMAKLYFGRDINLMVCPFSDEVIKEFAARGDMKFYCADPAIHNRYKEIM